MNGPTHERDGGDLPEEARAWLRAAPRPTPPDATERAAMVAMAARLAALPVAPTGHAGLKLVKLGGWKGVVLAGLLAVTGGSAVLTARTSGTAPESSLRGPSSTPAVVLTAPPPESLPATTPVQADDTQAPRRPAPPGDRPRAIPDAAPTARSACPVPPAERGDCSTEAPHIQAANRALGADPGLTLACLQDLTRLGGPWQLGDEHAFLSFEASRRLGRDGDARRWARALLRASPRSPYAAKVRGFLGEDGADAGTAPGDAAEQGAQRR